MKKILGLDLGTNSIGWALIEQNFNEKVGKVCGLGSRIIPMSQDVLGKFDSGVSISQTAERTKYRSVRRLYQRDNLRRERLHRVLNILGFLPNHYSNSIDFEKHFGQFKKNQEVKLDYRKNETGKSKFIFMDSFNEMVEEFKKAHQSVKIPYDWTIYYLRKKALTQKISNEELAWVILNFNQKRGYYQLRGEMDDQDSTKLEEYYALKVTNVEETEDKNAKGIWNKVVLENGFIYKRQSKESLINWIGKTKEFIVTTQLEKDGSFKYDKEGKLKRSFRSVDSEKDWIAIKKKSENDIEKSGETVGQYIYKALISNKNQKIRGKLIKTIERKFYREELEEILKVQIKLNVNLRNRNLYDACINELYPNNYAHRNSIKHKGFDYLLIEDIIFYQRPLKSKKSTIADCQFETRVFIKDNERKEKPLKAIPKSHPLFQEFRLWQFLKNLKIYQVDSQINKDVTSLLLKSEKDWVELFDFLNCKKEVESKNMIQYLVSKKLILKTEKENFRWNYVEDKKYPANETRSNFISKLKKVNSLNVDAFLTYNIEYKLWHIIYSVKDKYAYEQALKNFALKNSIDQDSFFESFKNFPAFKNEYGAYSEKAIKKLLPLMRRGSYWNERDISIDVKKRIYSIMERVTAVELRFSDASSKNNLEELYKSVADDDIPKNLVKSFMEFYGKNPLQGHNTFQAGYAVYNRHSEVKENTKWNFTKDIDNYLINFKQHSLRNPIVEQVITETLRVVRDIWQHFGKGEKDFFDEIHVELGREMKNPAEKRKSISEMNTINENTNNRIKELLKEFSSDASFDGEIRPYSPSQQEILKIYEEGVFNSLENIEDEILKIRKNSSPSVKQIEKYKLWLEQGYISPYTGIVIPLSRLFTTDYQIEHIIPQSRYFDNSFNNKVICESVINEEKSNATAYEFIKNRGGEIFDLGQGRQVTLFNLNTFEDHCSQYFKKNRSKLRKLLTDDIPEDFILRQLNDSRYISKIIKGLLSNIVREEGENESTSKHILPLAGAITSKLKHDWGLNNKWNEIIAPRFKRLNEITNSNDFGYWDDEINAFRVQIPDEFARGFTTKRIDHRHHALDALVIACCTRNHINYLNALSAENKNYVLRNSLLVKSKEGDYTKHFLLPWDNFTNEAKENLDKTIVSFKQNLRVINKTNNKYYSFKDEKGNIRLDKEGVPKKLLIKQTKGENWAIRKPLHNETVSGKVVLKRRNSKFIYLNSALEKIDFLVDKKLKAILKQKREFFNSDLKELKKYFKKNPIKINNIIISKAEIYDFVEATASRVPLNEKFTRKQLKRITDIGIQRILENHIVNFTNEKGEEKFDLAFNSDGIDELNRNIIKLNNGKFHKPIRKVRISEVGSKFMVGSEGNKNQKYVEAAKGTNLFFAIYWNKEKQKRDYETIPLNKIIEHQKQDALLPNNERTPVPINHSLGDFLFSLSPNDLVYVPSLEEIENFTSIDYLNLNDNQLGRIYKVVSSTGKRLYGVPVNSASSIVNKFEYSQLNKLEFTLDGLSIKEKCIKFNINRLGNIIS